MAVANGALLTGIMSSRLTYGMARDGLLPSVLTRVLPRRRTPWVAIIVTTALSVLLALTGTVAGLAATLVLLLLVVFIAVNLAVLVLRWRGSDGEHFHGPPGGAGARGALLRGAHDAGGRGVWLRGLLLLAVGAALEAASALRLRLSGDRPIEERSSAERVTG